MESTSRSGREATIVSQRDAELAAAREALVTAETALQVAVERRRQAEQLDISLAAFVGVPPLAEQEIVCQRLEDAENALLNQAATCAENLRECAAAVAECDLSLNKFWQEHGVTPDALLERVEAFDRHVASLSETVEEVGIASGPKRRELESQALTLAFCESRPSPHPLKFHSIGQIGYALFAPRGWARDKENAATLLEQRPVAISAGGEFSKRFQECCERAKLTPNLRFSCSSFTQVAELVRSGHAVALLPEMAEPNLRLWGVKRLDFEPMRAYRREIGIV